MQRRESSTDRLPLSRDSDGQLLMAGTGPVSLDIDYKDALGKGRHGVVFRGQIIDPRDGSLLHMVSAARSCSKVMNRNEMYVVLALVV